MSSLPEIAMRHAHLGLLWCASLLVPRRKRSEWSQEWRTELWYVLRECSSETNPDPRPIREATAFCLGAYKDAIWFRKQPWQEQRPLARIPGSAPACLLLLLGMFSSTWVIAHISHRVAAGMSRIQVYPWRESDKRAVPCDCAFDLMTERRSLRTTELFFDGFSHYKIAQEMVWSEAMPRAEWIVGHANADFFAVLHLPVGSVKPATRSLNGATQLVLSRETWVRDFGAEPKIIGSEFHVGSVNAVVAGIASDSSMDLPGTPKAWLLDSDSHIRTDNEEFVVGHLTSVGYFNDGRWALSAGGILLGILMIAVTSPSIGEYGNGSAKPSLRRRSQFWAFLDAKIAVWLGVVYFASLDLAFPFLQPFSQFSGYIQAASSFALCFFGLSWCFRDQQRRCPICLRRMARPVDVGQPSRTFLAWNGTELVCERGHTLLHIPEVRTSWFGVQRWVCLDGSWQFLFARSTRTSSLH